MWSKGTTKDILVTQEMPKVLRVLWREQGTETNTFPTVLHSFTHILPWLPTFLWAASVSAPTHLSGFITTCPSYSVTRLPSFVLLSQDLSSLQGLCSCLSVCLESLSPRKRENLSFVFDLLQCPFYSTLPHLHPSVWFFLTYART